MGFVNSIYTRRFEENDAKVIAEIIRRNLLEVNIKDYPFSEMELLAERFNVEWIINLSRSSHLYVACIDNHVLGCGAITSFWGKQDESIFLTIFVLPEMHGKGIGRKIVEALENDEYFLRAKRIEIPSSFTAYEFYRKLGYDFLGGVKETDGEGHYRLEKFR